MIIAREYEKVYGDYENLEVADKFAKQVIPEAEYMKKEERMTILFYPIEGEPQKNSFHYEINGKYYTKCITNKYSELVKYYKEKPQQISIFDI